VLHQWWVKLGVATTILKAVDAKSLALFVLVLLVAGLCVANSAIASVRSRRTDLGVLAYVGWTRAALFRLVVTELGVIALVAGVIAAGLSLLLGAAFGTPVSPSRALLAIPASLIVTLVAGFVPAYLAARSDPMDAVRPAVTAARTPPVYGTPQTATIAAEVPPGRIPARPARVNARWWWSNRYSPRVAGMLVGYARCSTDRQDLTAQRDALAALGVKANRIYVDHGLTGTNRARPGLREALAACRSGDTLVVTKLDRLARSLSDARDLIEELTEAGVKLNIGGSVHDPLDPVGRLLFNVLGMIAEFESDLIRMRTREGMQVAKAKGRLRGKQPKLTPTQEAHLVELWRAGRHTSAELAELFTVARSTVYRAVQRAGEPTTNRNPGT